MKKVKIIGVPEHFNLPWQLCIENGEFSQVGIDMEWFDVPEGTGKMCEMLRNGDTDLAVILTEGILKDISLGNPAVVVQEYVASPLQWGIFTAAANPVTTVEELHNKKVAISRFGSGSQLMAIVNAKQQGWNSDALQYEVVNTLNGGVEALTHGKADYFMWDRFMTQPLVDKGIFKRIGICPTPWPSFILVATQQFARENKPVISSVLEVLNTTSAEFKHIPSINNTVRERFQQKLEDVNEWLRVTHWSQKQISPQKFKEINEQLVNLGIIKQALNYNETVL